MPFFDKIGDALNKTGQDLKQKAKVISDTSNLKIERSQLLSEVERLYIEIGKAVYQSGDEKFTEQINQIRSKFERVKEIEEEVDSLKGNVKCPSCGEMVDATVRFCPHCGKEMSSE